MYEGRKPCFILTEVALTYSAKGVDIPPQSMCTKPGTSPSQDSRYSFQGHLQSPLELDLSEHHSMDTTCTSFRWGADRMTGFKKHAEVQRENKRLASVNPAFLPTLQIPESWGPLYVDKSEFEEAARRNDVTL